MQRVLLITLCFRLLLVPVLAPHAADAPPRELSITSDFPGGNIALERVEGDEVYVHQELRDTKGDWFYWYFAVRGAEGRELTFRFTRSRAIGLLGPGVSRDGGRTWQWLGRTPSPNVFTYRFGPDESEMRFSFGMPYQHADLLRFLDKHKQSPYLRREVLGKTRKGRPVDMLRIGRPDAKPEHEILVTVRHHACEMMASYVAEGLIEEFLSASEAGEWLRDHVQCVAIPMVDLDGVEDGDQGKNRQPHDHKADYQGRSIYPEVAALRRFLAEWAGGKPDVAIDLHDPSINHNRIYSHALRTREGQGEDTRVRERRFLETLEAVQQGPLELRVQDSVDFAARMARKPETASTDAEMYGGGTTPEPTASADRYTLNAGFEIPYALVGEVPVTPDSARAFGHDLARALAAYLRSSCRSASEGPRR